MKAGILEGLESSYDSHGLGRHSITFFKEPTVGEMFWFHGKRGHGNTGTVMSLRRDGDRISFRTKRTTYTLDVEPQP